MRVGKFAEKLPPVAKHFTKAKELKPDIVVLDISMPEINGSEAHKEHVTIRPGKTNY